MHTLATMSTRLNASAGSARSAARCAIAAAASAAATSPGCAKKALRWDRPGLERARH